MTRIINDYDDYMYAAGTTTSASFSGIFSSGQCLASKVPYLMKINEDGEK